MPKEDKMKQKLKLLLGLILVSFSANFCFSQINEPFEDSFDEAIPLILDTWDSKAPLDEVNLHILARYLSVDNFWLVSPLVREIKVEWAGSLVAVTNGFTAWRMQEGPLFEGIWWNTGNQSAFLSFGEGKSLFEMTPNSMLVFAVGANKDLFPDSREVVMLGGAARNHQEFNDLMRVDPNILSLIRSKAEWLDYLANSTQPGHPLSGLSEQRLQIITDSLVFRNQGLAGANIEEIRKHLNTDQIQEIFRLFGLDILSTLQNQDYRNYECDSPGNCRKNSCCICTSNC